MTVRCLPLLLLLAGAARAGPAAGVAGLRAEHPRLLATAAVWDARRAEIEADPAWSAFRANLLAAAHAIELEPVAQPVLRGRRMLGPARLVLRRVLLLVTAWRLTDDARWARRAEAELRAAAAFPDWNPDHFLDTAELSAALAIGYDELHGALSDGVRSTLREAIRDLGLRPALEASPRALWWHDNGGNWNVVGWSGVALGALAIAEDEPRLADKVLTRARRGLRSGLAAWAPDGVYPEGPSYAAYAATYAALLQGALWHGRGEAGGVADVPGFLQGGAASVQLTGPTGMGFNFGDNAESARFPPVLSWLASAAGRPEWIAAGGARFAGWRDDPAAFDDRFAPLVALWADGGRAGAVPSLVLPAEELPRAWLGRGRQPVAVLRSRWGDPQAAWLAIKGGRAAVSHGHADVGGFVFETRGVRWVRDLGPQDYGALEDADVALWQMGDASSRWKVFRVGPESHATPRVDGAPNPVDAEAGVSLRGGIVEVDLSMLLAGRATSARRGARLWGRGAVIQDEVTGLSPGSILGWAMVTPAHVTLWAGGRGATLRAGGRALRVRVDGGRLRAAPAEGGAPFDVPNPGQTLLCVEATAPANGAVRLRVVLAPAGAVVPAVRPLARW